MKLIKSSVALLFALSFSAGCFQGSVTNGSPELVVSYSTVVDHLEKETNSQSINLIAFEERNSNHEVTSADLRIDLIRPQSFSGLASDNNAKARELVRWVKTKLKNPEQYRSFSINEITEPTNTTPAPNISNTITFQRDEL